MIQSFQVKNFKSIKDSGKVELSRNTLFIGKNGSGKTNLINAIKLLKRLSDGEKLTDILRSLAPMTMELLCWDEHSTRSSFEFEIESITGRKYRYFYCINIASVSDVKITQERLEIIERDRNNQISYRVIFSRNGENISLGNTDEQTEAPILPNPQKIVLSDYVNEEIKDVVNTITQHT